VGKSFVAEVYPALWSRALLRGAATVISTPLLHRSMDDQADSSGSLATFAGPPLSEADRVASQIEGWILGVM
jgi:hypothetical protein